MGLRRFLRRWRVLDRRWIPNAVERERHQRVIEARLAGGSTHHQAPAPEPRVHHPPMAPDDEPTPDA